MADGGDKANKRKPGIDNLVAAFGLDNRDGAGWEILADAAEEETLEPIPPSRRSLWRPPCRPARRGPCGPRSRRVPCGRPRSSGRCRAAAGSRRPAYKAWAAPSAAVRRGREGHPGRQQLVETNRGVAARGRRCCRWRVPGSIENRFGQRVDVGTPQASRSMMNASLSKSHVCGSDNAAWLPLFSPAASALAGGYAAVSFSVDILDKFLAGEFNSKPNPTSSAVPAIATAFFAPPIAAYVPCPQGTARCPRRA